MGMVVCKYNEVGNMFKLITTICIFFIMCLLVINCNNNGSAPGAGSTDADKIKEDDGKNNVGGKLDKSRWINADAGLKLRSGPGTDYDTLGVIPYAEKVHMLSEEQNVVTIGSVKGKWSKVSWNNIEGWVFGGFLTENEILSPANNSDVTQDECSLDQLIGIIFRDISEIPALAGYQKRIGMVINGFDSKYGASCLVGKDKMITLLEEFVKTSGGKSKYKIVKVLCVKNDRDYDWMSGDQNRLIALIHYDDNAEFHRVLEKAWKFKLVNGVMDFEKVPLRELEMVPDGLDVTIIYDVGGK